ncbi:MAG: chromosomal replication initiator protein DnaA [Candidatus Peregrinibacteria bacterium]|nr:chromosomal replication initiator protein DnaA [Candidatus Peregrinibacteria bacterium]MCB9808372.1 chromosomal replication initiator protein DnaA [Candidatus Peribacteria bacterium]
MTSSACFDMWLDILKRIEPQLQRTAFITWFRNTAILSKEEGTLVVGLPLSTVLDRHIERYQGMVLEAAKEMDNSIAQLVYKVDGRLQDHPEACVNLLEHFPEQKKRKLPNKQEVRLAEGITSKILNPRYTMENFVVGTRNRLAHAACSAVVEQPGGKYNPLFIYGGVGLGKTHLLQAVGNAILQKSPRATVVYTTSEDFTNQVVEAIRTQKMEQVRKRYRQVDVLIVDDIQFFASKERCQEEFFHTFNALYEGSKQLIISSDRPPDELHLEDRLISRFERGMIADVSEPDYETRLAILQEKASEYEFFIDLSVLQFIAEHTTKNVRELEGILMQAVAQYELERRMPTIKSIAEIMSKLNKDPHVDEETVGFEKPEKRKATMQDVMEAVSKYYSVSIDDLIGSSRVHEVLMPRQMAMYIGKRFLNVSFVRLGETFGNRDHTTVMNACGKIEKSMNKNSNILREVHTLTAELGLR